MEHNGYLPKQECQFLQSVTDELETYQKKSSRKHVLLFPPLPSRLRYLIHSHIEDLPELTTFSVGENRSRRVVVSHSELRGDVDEDINSESSYSLCEEPLRSRSREEEASARPKSSLLSRSRGPKRPDKPLYMPRAARERLSLQNSQEPAEEQEVPSPSCPETTVNTEPCSATRQQNLPSVADCILSRVAETPVLCSQGLALHKAEPLDWDESVSSFADMTLEEGEKDKEFLSSVPYGDLTEELSLQIKAHLKEAETVSIEHVHNDYSAYVSMCIIINPDEFRHVIEIYDFPSIFKTDDLLDAFAEYSDGGMKIKWIDNTHALGVFSSELAAIHALSICHPMLKARALAEGSKKAKAKAIRSAEFIQPVKERPRTDCAVAQRMVSRALGLQRRGRLHRY